MKKIFDDKTVLHFDYTESASLFLEELNVYSIRELCLYLGQLRFFFSTMQYNSIDCEGPMDRHLKELEKMLIEAIIYRKIKQELIYMNNWVSNNETDKNKLNEFLNKIVSYKKNLSILKDSECVDLIKNIEGVISRRTFAENIE